MNFTYAQQVNPLLTALDFPAAIQLLESQIRSSSHRGFDPCLGRSFTSQAADLALWIENYYMEVLEGEVPVRALFLELNHFTEEFDKWHFNILSYYFDGGSEEFDWLLDFDTDATYEEVYPLVETDAPMEPFELFQMLEKRQQIPESLQEARDWAEQLILARSLELVHAAHQKAKEFDLEWADLPLYASLKEYNFAIRSI